MPALIKRQKEQRQQAARAREVKAQQYRSRSDSSHSRSSPDVEEPPLDPSPSISADVAGHPSPDSESDTESDRDVGLETCNWDGEIFTGIDRVICDIPCLDLEPDSADNRALGDSDSEGLDISELEDEELTTSLETLWAKIARVAHSREVNWKAAEQKFRGNYQVGLVQSDRTGRRKHAAQRKKEEENMKSKTTYVSRSLSC